ncbi:unnamed protein product, partial [Closterium sp. NIES-64]
TGTCRYGATCKFDHPPPAEAAARVAMGQSLRRLNPASPHPFSPPVHPPSFPLCVP